MAITYDLHDDTWLNKMPFRWAIGGLLLGIIWSATSSYLQDSFNSPAGGIAAGILRLVFVIILPLVILGLFWGYSEKQKLKRSVNRGSDAVARTLQRTIWRQVGKAIICGFAFAFYVALVSSARSYASWDTPDHIIANISKLSGFAILGIPVGIVVGYFHKRGLLRRFSH